MKLVIKIRLLILSLILIPFISNAQFTNLGGSLHSEITARKCDCRVYTADEFLTALSTDSCKKIWINRSIDLSGHTGISIPRGKTIASNGKIIFNSSMHIIPVDQLGNCLLFHADGDSIRITGIFFIGGNAEIGDHDYSLYGQSGLIKVNCNNFTFDNCKVINYDTWGVWINCGTNAVVRNNTFENIRRAGYGYSCWIGGCGNANGSHLIYGNIFKNTRHAVASSGHLTSFEIIYNLFTGNASAPNIDRHNYNTICYGGHTTNIHHNVFYTRNHHFGLQWPEDSAGLVSINNNWFTRDSINTGFLCDELYWKAPHDRVSVTGNYFTRVGMEKLGIDLPTPYIKPIIDTSNYLVFRYKDSYWGNLKGRYKIQVFAGSTRLMNKDVSGNKKTWNLAKLLIPENIDTIRIRFHCQDPTGINEINLWIDDISYQGNLQPMEGQLLPWKQQFSVRPPGMNQVGTGIRSDDSYSGDYSWRFTYNGKFQKGQFAEIYLIK